MKATNITNANLVSSHFLKQRICRNTYIHTFRKGHKDHKCESCSKSFSSGDLKNIHTIHEGHKDLKCESCGNSFTRAQYL